MYTVLIIIMLILIIGAIAVASTLGDIRADLKYLKQQINKQQAETE